MAHYLPIHSVLSPNLCPICREDCTANKACAHFIGWTEDGINIVPRVQFYGGKVLDNDLIIKTGVSARVFRPASSL